MQTIALLAETQEQLRDIGAPTIVYGLLGFGLLLALLFGTLAFGKGRPHS